MQRPILLNVQILRFVAASAVLFSHARDALQLRPTIVTAIPWTAGVDVFFIISGFIMTWMTDGQFGSNAAARRFLLRRIIRIVPVYWFFTLVGILVGLADNRFQADWAQLVCSLLLIPWPGPHGHLVPILEQGWTLNYEAFFYLFFAASMYFRRGLMMIIAAFLLLAAVHGVVPSGWFVLRFYTGPHILEFAGGIALGRLYLDGRRLRTAGAVALGATGLLFFAAVHSKYGLLLHIGVPATLIATAIIFAPEPKQLGPLRLALQAGGDASYTLYLSHTFTLAAAIAACEAFHLRAPWLMLGLALFAAISASVLFYRAVESPLIRFLGRQFHLRAAPWPASVAP